MAEIRISKLAKQFSIGVQTLVDFLNEKGAGLGTDPNAKISDEYLPAIEAKFGEDLKLKKDAENVVIKLKDIVERGAKKKPEQEEEEIVEKEIVIKTNTLNSDKPAPAPVEQKPVQAPVEPVVEKPARQEEGGLKIIGKIDLSKPAQKAQPEKPAQQEAEPAKVAKAEEVKPAVQESKVVEPVKQEVVASAPVVEEKRQEAPVKVEREEPMQEVRQEPREIKVQVEKLQGPKVVDKIDLSQFDRKKKKKRERIEKGGSQKVDVTQGR